MGGNRYYRRSNNCALVLCVERIVISTMRFKIGNYTKVRVCVAYIINEKNGKICRRKFYNRACWEDD